MRELPPPGIAQEARRVELQLMGVRQEVRLVQGILVFEERVVHRPEPALCGGRLGRLGRHECVRMDILYRKMPIHEPHGRSMHLAQLPEGRLVRQANGALVVAVFENHATGRRPTRGGHSH